MPGLTEPSGSTRRRFLACGAGFLLAVPLVGRAGASGVGHQALVPAVRGRDAWGSGLAPGPLEPEPDVRFLLVHHTAGNTQHRPDDVPGILRGIYEFHTGPEKRWPDIAYNFLIDRYGVVWEGRAGSVAGAVTPSATGGNQGFSQTVSLIGDFTSTLPTAEALRSLTGLLAWLSDRHGIATGPGARTTFTSRGSNRWPAGAVVETATIAGHRSMSLTTCPGDAFAPYVETTLQGEVEAHRLTTRATTTTSPSPTTASPATTPPPGHSESTPSTAATDSQTTGSSAPAITNEAAGAPGRTGSGIAAGDASAADGAGELIRLGGFAAAVLLGGAAGLLALRRRATSEGR